MSEYKIEAGVEFVKREKFPVSQLEVGESFLVPLEGDFAERYKETLRVRATVYRVAKNGRKFRTQTMEERLRVWRVE